MIQWLQITSGRGPEECCRVTALLVQRIAEDAKAQNISTHILETVPGVKPHTLKSALLALEGEALGEFVSQWAGTIQWIGKSPFRPHHKRKNWFVRVSGLNPPQAHQWSDREIRFETMRASGPGGQHVNKNETAVRVIHLPTRMTALAQEERSQHLNRKLALSRLAELLREAEAKYMLGKQKERWDQHNRLERGNPIRIYEGEELKCVKRKK